MPNVPPHTQTSYVTAAVGAEVRYDMDADRSSTMAGGRLVQPPFLSVSQTLSSARSPSNVVAPPAPPDCAVAVASIALKMASVRGETARRAVLGRRWWAWRGGGGRSTRIWPPLSSSNSRARLAAHEEGGAMTDGVGRLVDTASSLAQAVTS